MDNIRLKAQVDSYGEIRITVGIFQKDVNKIAWITQYPICYNDIDDKDTYIIDFQHESIEFDNLESAKLYLLEYMLGLIYNKINTYESEIEELLLQSDSPYTTISEQTLIGESITYIRHLIKKEKEKLTWFRY